MTIRKARPLDKRHRYDGGMRLAPAPVLSATLAPAPSGPGAVFHTLRLMREAINAGKTDPVVMNAAVAVVYMTPEKDQYRGAVALYEYVRDHIKYISDVYGVETLASPRITLARMVGDCDDQTALLGAMLESVGFPTRLIMTAYQSEEFEHVYLETFAAGQWWPCDPTEHQFFGWEAPDYHKKFIEGA